MEETDVARRKLAGRLQQVEKELVESRRELRRLKTAHHDQLGPVKLTQTRLEARSHRPNTEACHDSPHIRSVNRALVFTYFDQ